MAEALLVKHQIYKVPENGPYGCKMLPWLYGCAFCTGEPGSVGRARTHEEAVKVLNLHVLLSHPSQYVYHTERKS